MSVKRIQLTVDPFLVVVPGDREELPLLANASFVLVGLELQGSPRSSFNVTPFINNCSSNVQLNVVLFEFA